MRDSGDVDILLAYRASLEKIHETVGDNFPRTGVCLLKAAAAIEDNTIAATECPTLDDALKPEAKALFHVVPIMRAWYKLRITRRCLLDQSKSRADGKDSQQRMSSLVCVRGTLLVVCEHLG